MNPYASRSTSLRGILAGFVLLFLLGFLLITGLGFRLLAYLPAQLGLLKTFTAADVVQITAAAEPATVPLAQGEYGLWAERPIRFTHDVEIWGETAVRLTRSQTPIQNSLFPGTLLFTFTTPANDAYRFTFAPDLHGRTLTITPLYEKQNRRALALFYLLPIITMGLAIWLWRWRSHKQGQRQNQQRAAQWDKLLTKMRDEDKES